MFFICGYPIFPLPFVEETVFPTLCILAFLVIEYLTIGAWVYLWVFYSVPLIYISVYHAVLMTVALQYSLKSGSLIPPVLFFFFKIALPVQGLLCLHRNFKIFVVVVLVM